MLVYRRLAAVPVFLFSVCHVHLLCATCCLSLQLALAHQYCSQTADLLHIIDPCHSNLHMRVAISSWPEVDRHLQVDRNEDMVRSCLRAVEAVSRIPNVDTSVPFKTFMSNTVLTGTLQGKFKAIRQERAEADGLDASASKW